ncbi:MAG: glycoside hydrolase family 5 protein [Cytophagales bacterium]
MKIKFLAFLMMCASVWAQSTIVEKYGHLQVKGNYIFGEKGDTVQLRGMSLFWSQWMGQYYTPECVKWLKDDWKCTIVRAAMGVDAAEGGYEVSPAEEKAKIETVVDAAIANGMYVIIDYHSHHADKNVELAKKFFTEMALKYNKYPNVIYELYNEPLQESTWDNDIKPYCEAVIKEIRKYDTKNLIVCGTRQWSQMVSEAAANPIKDNNVAYTLHYYVTSHGKSLRDEAEKAMKMGICLFVTEFGTCHASGNGGFNPKQSKVWWDFLDKYHISWCNWSVADKVETASIINPGASGKGGWKPEELTESGNLVKAELVAKNTPILEKLKAKTEAIEKIKSEKIKADKKINEAQKKMKKK